MYGTIFRLLWRMFQQYYRTRTRGTACINPVVTKSNTEKKYKLLEFTNSTYRKEYIDHIRTHFESNHTREN